MKHSPVAVDKQREKLAALEMQLAATSTGQHGQEETAPFGNTEKESLDTDTTVKDTIIDDGHSESYPPNANPNDDRPHGAPPKVIH